MKVLGISASLRSVRFGADNNLCEDLRSLSSEEGLLQYLKDQTKVDLKAFMDRETAKGVSVEELKKSLSKNAKSRGMSNSETALAVALWGAHQGSCEIDYLCLAAHMTPECEIKNKDVLKEKLLSADALILSGPVYFGDRGSLSQSLFEFIRTEPDLLDHVKGLIFAGLAVGAKRNGGQETTLIYQMVDAITLGMLAVGNGSSTTAQYGGTIVAGDAGTCCNDVYGMKTALSTGTRVAEVLSLRKNGASPKIDRVQIGVWLLQDDLKGSGLAYAERFCREADKKVKGVTFVVRNITQEFIYRCIACDLCPSAIGPMDEYRCTVKTQNDFFCKNHQDLLHDDAILLMAYSPEDMMSIVSKYQQFIERTRYLRRDNYVFANRLASAFVISEINANKNLHIRMLTSIIRHNTILHKAVIGYEQNGVLLNPEAVETELCRFAREALSLTGARLGKFIHAEYQPLGYIISQESAKSTAVACLAEEYRKNRQSQHERSLLKRAGRK